MSQPTPPRLRNAKAAAVTAAVMATSAALTVGLTTPVPEAFANRAPSSAAPLPVVQHDVDLAALAGFYGVGPMFQLASLAGLGSPDAALDTAKTGLGLLPNTEGMIQTINTLQGLLGLVVGPNGLVDMRVPGAGPQGTYDAVNGLEGTFDFAVDRLGIPDWLVPDNPPAILNQRRAFILAESFGGTNTSLALRDMIKAVQSGDDSWPDGVTAIVAVMVRNPSRPGGGLLALMTPFTELAGLNLSTPDGKQEGNGGNSYADDTDDPSKILNFSIIDITAAYDFLSDAPTSLNPVSWANSAMTLVMPTYLIPDNNAAAWAGALGSLGPLGPGILNALGVTLDPTGGQGTSAIPIVDDIFDFLHIPPIPGIVGTNTYVTYNSGNLPLLEPFQAAPRLLSYLPGFNITTPVSSSFEDALTQLVALGYQDVNLEEKNGIPTFTRGFDMGGVQAEIWKNPITNEQSLQVPQALFNATINGLKANLLSPEKQELVLGGADIGDAVYHNAASLAVAHALRDVLSQVQTGLNPVFDGGEDILRPFAKAMDGVTGQVNTAVDDTRAGIKEQNVDLPSTVNALSTGKSPKINSLPSLDKPLRTLNVVSDADVNDDKTATGTKKPTPLKDAAKALGLDQESVKDSELSKGLKKVTESLKATPKQGRHAADPSNAVKKSVQDTIDRVQNTVKDAAGKVEKAVKDAAPKSSPKKDTTAKKDSAPKKDKDAA
ncbi:ATPase AAA [Mycolicibacterium mageritense]|nr:ATPase AAA [Mycolicibacterium mageritense]